jgi:hypothetical protein
MLYHSSSQRVIKIESKRNIPAFASTVVFAHGELRKGEE